MQKPVLIHSDSEPAFSSKKIRTFLQESNIELFLTLGNKNQNQVSESINERIKTLVTKGLITKNTEALREWRKNVPSKLKHLTINNKSRNTEFHQLLFHSQLFKQEKINAITDAISQYNQTEFTSGISRQEAEYYNSKLEPKNSENIQLIKSND